MMHIVRPASARPWAAASLPPEFATRPSRVVAVARIAPERRAGRELLGDIRVTRDLASRLATGPTVIGSAYDRNYVDVGFLADAGVDLDEQTKELLLRLGNRRVLSWERPTIDPTAWDLYAPDVERAARAELATLGQHQCRLSGATWCWCDRRGCERARSDEEHADWIFCGSGA